MKLTSRENGIQRQICDYLAAKRYFFWRNNSYGIFDVKGGFHRALPKYSIRGVPDIILIKEGRFIGLEVKRKDTYQSQEQKDFERRCKEEGAEYHVVRDVTDLMEIGL